MDIEEEQDGGTDGGTENYSDANMSDASIERGSKVIAGKQTNLLCNEEPKVQYLNCLVQIVCLMFVECCMQERLVFE